MLDFISEDKDNNYVLTNELLEDASDRNCYAQVKQASHQSGSLFVPVKLHISREENAKRIVNPDRKDRYKSLALDENSTKPLINIEDPNLLELDVTSLSAVEAANIIMEFAKNRDKTTSPVKRPDPIKDQKSKTINKQKVRQKNEL